MKKRISCLILPLAALVLELLPYGAVCNFANPDGAPWRKTCSYFDPLPFGYANFAPLLTALLTCAVLAVLLAFLFTGSRRVLTLAGILLCAAVTLSLCPLLLGIRFFSAVGALISAALLAELCLLIFVQKKMPA